jgi:hypothetical protein
MVPYAGERVAVDHGAQVRVGTQDGSAGGAELEGESVLDALLKGACVRSATSEDDVAAGQD